MSDPENNIKSKTYKDPIAVTDFYVRYAETDAMRVVHHAAYLVYFEEGRSQLMRNLGEIMLTSKPVDSCYQLLK